MSCALQAVTDIVPVASENQAYAGLTSNGTSLFVIDPADQKVGRVPVNGGVLVPVGDYIVHVFAVSGSTVVGGDTSGVVKVSTDGTGATRLIDGHYVSTIETDGARVFWSDAMNVDNSVVWSMAIDGSDAHQIIARPGTVTSLRLVDGALTWIELGAGRTSFSVVTASTDGTIAGDPVVIAGQLHAAAWGGSGLYLSDGTQILFLAKGASAPSPFVSDQATVTSIAVDLDRVYWTKNINCVTNAMVGNGTPVCGGVVSSVPALGGSPVDLPGSDDARMVASDGSCVYWTTTMGQFHLEAPIGIRGAPKALASP